jgi:hypothetical protein
LASGNANIAAAKPPTSPIPTSANFFMYRSPFQTQGANSSSTKARETVRVHRGAVQNKADHRLGLAAWFQPVRQPAIDRST